MVSEKRMVMAAPNRRIWRTRPGSGAFASRELSKCLGKENSGVRTPRRGVGRRRQRGVVEVLGEGAPRRAPPPPPLGLLGQQFGVALGNPRAPAAAYFKIACCACRHGSSPPS